MKVKERDKGVSCGEFWRKWDEKKRNTLIQILVVTFLMVITFSVSICQHLKNLEEETEGVVNRENFGYGKASKANSVCSVLKNYNCAVTCKDIDFNNKDNVDDLYDSLEDAKKEYEKCSLLLEEAKFKHSALEENWIQLDPAKHPKITELNINKGNLEDVKENSFFSLPDLIALTISFTYIKSLRKESFLHLSTLKNLQFSDNVLLQNVENGFLQNFELDTITVQSLQIGGKTAVEFFGNLTGDAAIKSVRTIDWSYNNVEYFPKRLLNNFPYIQILTLRGSHITEFEEGSFNEISKTENIYLDYNNLKRLPEEIFRPVVETVDGLYVDHNQLICDCDMEWLQIFVQEVKNYTYGDFQNVRCSGPDQNEGVPFLEAIMCPTTETTTEILSTTLPTEWPTTTSLPTGVYSTSSTSVITTPTTEIPTFPVDCVSLSRSSRFRRSILSTKFRLTPRTEITIRLPVRTLNFEIEERDEIVHINIGQRDETVAYNLLYWKGDLSYRTNQTIRCFSNIRTTDIPLPVDDRELDHETDYMFCIFNSPDEEINILNCEAYKTQPSYDNRAWLTNKSIPLTSYLIIVGAAVFAIIGASSFYLLVRKNPSLIRGSKRVIVVKRHNKAQIMVLPSGYTNHSSITDTAKYTLTDSSVRDSTALSVSGDSISTASYISALQPTPIEIFTYRLERLQALTSGNGSEEDVEEVCGTPPPLPPYPMTFSSHQGRVPPNVDLLFEYEWYTTTTMTTTS